MIPYVIPVNELISEYFWSGDRPIKYYLLFREHFKLLTTRKTILCASESIKIRFLEFQLSNIFGRGAPQWGSSVHCAGANKPKPQPPRRLDSRAFGAHPFLTAKSWIHAYYFDTSHPKLGVFSKAHRFQPSCVHTIMPNSQSLSHKLQWFNQANATENNRV